MDMNKKELLVEPLFKCRLFILKQANKKKKTAGGLNSMVKEKERERGIAWIYLLYQVNYFQN